MEIKSCEKRNSDIAYCDTHQEIESQRLQLQQGIQWADQAQREKIILRGELEMRNRLFREDHSRYCQETEELRRICCEETDRARQARIDEWSMHQKKKDPPTVSQLSTQLQELQDKVNSLSHAREFYDPETASSSGATHVPSQPLCIPSPRTMPCCDSGLPHDTRNIMGTPGNVFERLRARHPQNKDLTLPEIQWYRKGK